jgi:CheY-like chemotaxis protein
MKKTILLVDDEELVLKTMSRVLSNESYEVLTASSGAAALEVMEQQDVRVFFLDLNMPGMSGVELCEKIKAEDPVSCVYALTGYADDYTIAQCREAGFDDYFTKPFKIAEMLDAAQDAFDKLLRWENQGKDSDGDKE